MLDRVWWIWQMQDPDARVDLIPGQGAQSMSHPMARDPDYKPVPRATPAKDTIVDLGWTAPPIALGKLNDLLGGNDGKVCYIYV